MSSKQERWKYRNHAKTPAATESPAPPCSRVSGFSFLGGRGLGGGPAPWAGWGPVPPAQGAASTQPTPVPRTSWPRRAAHAAAPTGSRSPHFHWPHSQGKKESVSQLAPFQSNAVKMKPEFKWGALRFPCAHSAGLSRAASPGLRCQEPGKGPYPGKRLLFCPTGFCFGSAVSSPPSAMGATGNLFQGWYGGRPSHLPRSCVSSRFPPAG